MDRINVTEAFASPPPPQDFVLPGFLAGTVGGLVAPGSTGKSFWALEAAAAVVSAPADLLALDVAHHGPALYISLEEPADELRRRVHALGQHLTPEARESVAGGLHIISRQGLPSDVMDKKFRAELTTEAEGVRLVILDTLSRVHKLDENSNGDMAQVIATLEAIARQTGAAVLYLHHASKAAALAGQGALQQAARGASALVDNARWVGNLVRMTEDEAGRMSDRMDGAPIGERRGYYVRFELGKQNYGQVQDARWYERTAGGILRPASLKTTKKSRGGCDDL